MISIGEITYDESKILGEGAFGKVYDGRFRLEKAAVKKVKFNQVSLKKVLEEARILRTLCCSHPNIIRMFDVQADKNHIYICMEYCDGGSFEDFLSAQKLTEEMAKYFIPQICKGLEALHLNKIVHRDLKPDNILLKFQNVTGNLEIILKISDFGVSRFILDGMNANTFAGTEVYMAPEVLSYVLYNEMCDMWSVGIILFKGLTGQFPFTSLTYLVNAFRQKKELFIENKLKSYTISQALKDLIQKLLIVNPHKRLTVNEMANHNYLEECYRSNVQTGFVMDWYSQRNSRTKLQTSQIFGMSPGLAFGLGIAALGLLGFGIYNINKPSDSRKQAEKK
uniref:Protein kinase domain-containing protein n=1 Tax=Megaselia scalaris TaxID=36166 RepID=T1GS47_MEGSC